MPSTPLLRLGPAPSGENAKQRQFENDGAGRLTSVCEVSSSVNGHGTCAQSHSQSGLWTKYTYDALGDLLTVAQNAQSGTSQNRTYTYDGLGRLTSESNPETGATSYVYDSIASGNCAGTFNGDLIKRTDAVGNVTCYTYDALHRVKDITYPTGSYASSTAQKHFVYDTATVNGVAMVNAKGRLAEAYTGTSGSKTTDLGFSYTVRGEVSDTYESTPHSSGYYHLTGAYWAHGPLKSLSGLPGIPTIYYGASDGSGLDGEGRFTKVNASTGQNPITGVTYANSGTTQPIGSLTQATLGSADYDTFSYDVNTGRLTQYKFNVGSPLKTDTGNLTWNANGTLQQLAITDQLNSSNTQTCTYGYDDLSRVTIANCGTPWNQSFSFDPFGNVTKAGSLNWACSTCYDTTKNRYNSTLSPSITYDLNGNLTYDTFHAYSWDVEGKSLTIDTVSLTYDALDRMVEQNHSGTYTETVYMPGGAKLALMTGQTLQKAFVPLPGGGTAVYNSSGLAYYRHPDWLGSSRLATTPSRTCYWDTAYAPFGENYASPASGCTAQELSFTGQNQDAVSGMYDFLYREYHPNQGRWISPDPAGMGAVDPTSPQTWNRYAYVANEPLSWVDPLGLDMCLGLTCINNSTGGAGYGGPWNGGPSGGWGGGYGGEGHCWEAAVLQQTAVGLIHSAYKKRGIAPLNDPVANGGSWNNTSVAADTSGNMAPRTTPTRTALQARYAVAFRRAGPELELQGAEKTATAGLVLLPRISFLGKKPRRPRSGPRTRAITNAWRKRTYQDSPQPRQSMSSGKQQPLLQKEIPA